jgi:AAHS family 4-hydroxybenzoate transporter-like MFS transporter
MWAVGGLVGGLGVVALLSRGGVALLAVMFLVAVPFLAFMAWDLSPSLLIACVLIAGITVGAIQIGANTLVGLLYQTGVRVTGVGWALGVGRIGAILGPVVGSAVFALQLPPREMFGLSAVPMAIGALAAIFLAILCYRRFGGLQFDEAVQAPPAVLSAEPRRTQA